VTGAFDFNPDRFLQADQPAAEVHKLHEMPKAWEHGLSLLAERNTPRGASVDRWQQVLADARRIATIHCEEALASGWNTANLFGYDPKQLHGWVGLAVRLRGRPLIKFRPEHAVIRIDGGYIWHRPEMANDAPLLWSFRDPPERSR